MKFGRFKIAAIVILLLITGAYYYAALPAVNIHSPGLWGLIIWIFVALTLISSVYSLKAKYGKSENFFI